MWLDLSYTTVKQDYRKYKLPATYLHLAKNTDPDVNKDPTRINDDSLLYKGEEFL